MTTILGEERPGGNNHLTGFNADHDGETPACVPVSRRDTDNLGRPHVSRFNAQMRRSPNQCVGEFLVAVIGPVRLHMRAFETSNTNL